MSAYVIADITVNDLERYENYKNSHRRLLLLTEVNMWCAAEKLKNLRVTGNRAV